MLLYTKDGLNAGVSSLIPEKTVRTAGPRLIRISVGSAHGATFPLVSWVLMNQEHPLDAWINSVAQTDSAMVCFRFSLECPKSPSTPEIPYSDNPAYKSCRSLFTDASGI
jgi:hypothetical protein